MDPVGTASCCIEVAASRPLRRPDSRKAAGRSWVAGGSQLTQFTTHYYKKTGTVDWLQDWLEETDSRRLEASAINASTSTMEWPEQSGSRPDASSPSTPVTDNR